MCKVYNHYETITPADGEPVAPHDAIYVGTGGNLYVKRTSGSSAELFVVPAGALLPIKVYSIENANTTASNIKLLKEF